MGLELLKQLGKAFLTAALTDSYVREVIIHMMEYLASKTENKIDDDAVEIVKKLLEPAK